VAIFYLIMNFYFIIIHLKAKRKQAVVAPNMYLSTAEPNIVNPL